jgi:hypothetical protein
MKRISRAKSYYILTPLFLFRHERYPHIINLRSTKIYKVGNSRNQYIAGGSHARGRPVDFAL